MGVLCRGGESRDVEHTRMSRRYGFAIGEPGNNRLVDWTCIGDRCSDGEKKACGTGIKDSPCFDEGHVKIDGLEQGGCSDSLILGRVQATLRYINIYFMKNIVCPCPSGVILVESQVRGKLLMSVSVDIDSIRKL